jgi:hypothetical protein
VEGFETFLKKPGLLTGLTGVRSSLTDASIFFTYFVTFPEFCFFCISDLVVARETPKVARHAISASENDVAFPQPSRRPAPRTGGN